VQNIIRIPFHLWPYHIQGTAYKKNHERPVDLVVFANAGAANFSASERY
jgi:hypothetical protein